MSDFSRTYRLITKDDYQSVFTHSTKYTYKNIVALTRPNELFHARLGIIISKRYFKRAVDRNLVKRVIRESFRHYKDLLKGLDIVILFRSECSPLDKQILRQNIDHLWVTLAKSLKQA